MPGFLKCDPWLVHVLQGFCYHQMDMKARAAELREFVKGFSGQGNITGNLVCMLGSVFVGQKHSQVRWQPVLGLRAD